MADVAAALAALEAAVEGAAVLVGPDAIRDLRRDLADVRRRHGYLGGTVVAAIAGGTGVGKSSLLNAIAQEPVSPVGVLRPTTDRPVAWVPEGAEVGVLRLLDDLGVDERVAQRRLPGLALIDLPDFDSVELAHRATVEAVTPQVDAVLWVLDPEKYNDRSLHVDYIAPLAAHADRFVFVLNQVDRLADDETADVLDDLRASLHADGIANATLLPVAADPSTGDPRGVDGLTRLLASTWTDKQVAIDAVAARLHEAADRLAAVTEADADAPDLDSAWAAARAAAADALADGVVDAAALEQAQRAGGRAASAAASGPVGRIGHAVRSSAAGRALGLPPDEPAPRQLLAARRAPVALERAQAILGGMLTEASLRAGPATGRRLRRTVDADRLGADARAALDAAVGTVDPPGAVPARPAWHLVAVVQTLLTLAVVAGLVWLWADPARVAPGDFPTPVVLVLAALLVGGLLRTRVRRAGERAGLAAATAYRDEVRTAVADGLERRVGTRLAEIRTAQRQVGEGLEAARRALRD